MGYGYVNDFSLTVWASSTWFGAWRLRRFKKPGALRGLEPAFWFRCVLCLALWTVLSVM